MTGRTLVTGANGFVGRAVCEALSEADLPVRAAVRGSDKLEPRPFDNEVVSVGHIGPATIWAPALDGVDTVVHLAGRVHVLKETFEDPLSEFHKINALGAEHLAREAARAGVRRLIYVSSIGVNGRATRKVPFTEEHEPAPHNPYAVSKWEAELGLRRVSGESGLEVVVLRPPLVYGPHVKANFLRLMQLVSRDLPLPLGSVRNRRSLLYVGNLADAIVTSAKHPKAAGQTFLVSDDEDVSTPELISRIAAALHHPVRLLPFPPGLLRAMGRLNRRLFSIEPLLDSLVVNSGKIRGELEWRPPYSLKEGMEHTARWFEARSSDNARVS